MEATSLNVNCQTFTVTKDTKLTTVAVPINKMSPGTLQAASGTGGLGNKQTESALSGNKLVYQDILLHNLHVSIQDFQKKQKMYQKRVTRRRAQEVIYPPEIQYLNIYKKTATRLSVFTDMDEQADAELLPADAALVADATSYEKYLDQQLRQLQLQEKESACQLQAYHQATAQQTSFNLEALTLGLAQVVGQQSRGVSMFGPLPVLGH